MTFYLDINLWKINWSAELYDHHDILDGISDFLYTEFMPKGPIAYDQRTCPEGTEKLTKLRYALRTLGIIAIPVVGAYMTDSKAELWPFVTAGGYCFADLLYVLMSNEISKDNLIRYIQRHRNRDISELNGYVVKLVEQPATAVIDIPYRGVKPIIDRFRKKRRELSKKKHR